MDNQFATPDNKDPNKTSSTSMDGVSRPSLSDTSSGPDSNSVPLSSSSTSSPSVKTVGSGGKKSKGMSLLLTILAIIIFVGGIYGVYYYEHNKVKTLDGQVSNLQTQVTNLNNDLAKKSAATSTSTSTTSNPSTSNLTVIKIPGLGVQFSVPAILADITTSVNSANTVANLSTQTLTDLDTACTSNSATGLALGNVTKTTGQFKTTSGVTLIKQYPTYYIAYVAPTSGCSKVTQVNSLNNTLITDFKSTFSTIETTS